MFRDFFEVRGVRLHAYEGPIDPLLAHVTKLKIREFETAVGGRSHSYRRVGLRTEDRNAVHHPSSITFRGEINKGARETSEEWKSADSGAFQISYSGIRELGRQASLRELPVVLLSLPFPAFLLTAAKPVEVSTSKLVNPRRRPKHFLRPSFII
jgi:hypothetical protein